MTRPFPFETPVGGAGLIDRRGELHALHLAAVDGAHVRVAGPRRYGKTSLLLAHERSLEQGNWRAVHVDLYGVTSLAEVCARIANAYAKLGSPQVRSHLESLTSRLGITLSTSGIGLTLGPRPAPPPYDATLLATAELLDLPVRLYERDRRPTLVVLDEFQDLLAAGPHLDGLLRSHVQYHGDAATYIYAGSQPSLMRRLFTDRERPLYGQAEPLELAPLPIDEVLAEMHARFVDLGEDPGDALAPLMVAASGHPQRIMLFGHLLHRELAMRASGSTTFPETPELEGLALADAIVDQALRQTKEGHAAIWDSLSAGKKAVLAAMADQMRPTGSRATGRSGLSRATLQSALRELGHDGQHIARNQGGPTAAGYWRFVDPLFALWVARRGHVGASSDG